MKKEGVASKSALELIPVDRNVVVGLDWKKIQASPMGPKLKEGMPPDVASLSQDIDNILIGLNVQGPAQKDPNFVAVISGKLDSNKIMAEVTKQAQKDGVTLATEDYEGVTLHVTPKNPEAAFAFVEDKALVGSKDALKKAIDLSKKKGQSLEGNQAVMNLIKGVDKGKMIWAVGSIPPGMIPASGAADPGNPMASLANLKAIDLSLDYADNLVLDLGVFTGSAEDAKQLQTMANSYKTLFGGSLAQKDPSFGKVLTGLTIDAKEDKIILTLKLDKATVEELSKKAPGALPGGAGAASPMGEPMPPPPEAVPPPPPAEPAPPAPAAAAPQ
jgi:hypothetical protein